MNISFFGLGYVGAVSSTCLAARGHKVFGVDINEKKVEKVNAGRSPIIEPGLDEKIKNEVQAGRLIATTDPKVALANSEICFVAVATPSRNNGQINPSSLHNACKQIAEALLALNKKQIVVIRSSVLPNFYRECEKIFQQHAPGRVDLCANPEFLREGSAIKDFENPPYTVIGTSNRSVEQQLRHLYEDMKSPIFVVSPEEAIMVKYASNTFHGLKVVFANEIGQLCKALSVDSHRVMSVFIEDKHLNISSYYLKPGFAFGGSCLPKDIRAVLYAAKETDIELPVIQNILYSNKRLIENMLQKIIGFNKKKIGFVGLSFKSNTDDLRESPLVELAERLIGKGIELSIYDQNISLANLTGANKIFIDEAIPHLSKLLVPSLEDLVKRSEVIIVGHKYSGVERMNKLCNESQIIFDFNYIYELKTNPGQYHGICW